MGLQKLAAMGLATVLCCGGCGGLTPEETAEVRGGLQQAKEGVQDALAQTGEIWESAQAEMAEEMAKINWAQEILTPQANTEQKKLRFCYTNAAGEQMEVPDTNALLEELHADTWTRIEALPEGAVEERVFEIRQQATIQLGETVSQTDYEIAQMTVYTDGTDGYVVLDILDGITKFLDIVISKENFTAVYAVKEDVIAVLQQA